MQTKRSKRSLVTFIALATCLMVAQEAGSQTRRRPGGPVPLEQKLRNFHDRIQSAGPPTDDKAIRPLIEKAFEVDESKKPLQSAETRVLAVLVEQESRLGLMMPDGSFRILREELKAKPQLVDSMILDVGQMESLQKIAEANDMAEVATRMRARIQSRHQQDAEMAKQWQGTSEAQQKEQRRNSAPEPTEEMVQEFEQAVKSGNMQATLDQAFELRKRGYDLSRLASIYTPNRRTLETKSKDGVGADIVSFLIGEKFPHSNTVAHTTRPDTILAIKSIVSEIVHGHGRFHEKHRVRELMKTIFAENLSRVEVMEIFSYYHITQHEEVRSNPEPLFKQMMTRPNNNSVEKFMHQVAIVLDEEDDVTPWKSDNTRILGLLAHLRYTKAEALEFLISLSADQITNYDKPIAELLERSPELAAIYKEHLKDYLTWSHRGMSGLRVAPGIVEKHASAEERLEYAELLVKAVEREMRSRDSYASLRELNKVLPILKSELIDRLSEEAIQALKRIETAQNKYLEVAAIDFDAVEKAHQKYEARRASAAPAVEPAKGGIGSAVKRLMKWGACKMALSGS